MPKPIDLTGREFGYLKVVRFAGISDKKVRKWECKCKCGNIIYVRVADLTSGNTKSCGCLQKEIAKKSKTKHGCCKERLYRIWCNMKTRCTNPKTAPTPAIIPSTIKLVTHSDAPRFVSDVPTQSPILSTAVPTQSTVKLPTTPTDK